MIPQTVTTRILPGKENDPTAADVVETADMLPGAFQFTAFEMLQLLEGRGFETSEGATDKAIRLLYQAGYLRPLQTVNGDDPKWTRTELAPQKHRGLSIILVERVKRKRKAAPSWTCATVRESGAYVYVWCRKKDCWVELSAHRHRGCQCGADVFEED